MKTKIVSFIKTILSLLIIVLLLFLGYIIYNEIPKTNIADDVEEFVSNITTASGGTDKNTIQTPPSFRGTNRNNNTRRYPNRL